MHTIIYIYSFASFIFGSTLQTAQQELEEPKWENSQEQEIEQQINELETFDEATLNQDLRVA